MKFPDLKMHGTRYWEYPFAFSLVMEKPGSKILDIGIGRGIFASILKEHGHDVVGVDNYESCWSSMKEVMDKTGITCIHADARDLNPIGDGEFDIALLISMIEHVPSNTIFCEKRQTIKTGAMLEAEIPQKLKVISEAVRVVRPGGIVVITSDIYIDYPAEMNLSWRKMLGLPGIDREDVNDLNDAYLYDNPIHKGRILPVGVVIKKG